MCICVSIWQQQTFRQDFFDCIDPLGLVTEEGFCALREIVAKKLLSLIFSWDRLKICDLIGDYVLIW